MTGRRMLSPLYAPSGAPLDSMDLELLRRLNANGRMENQALAQAVGLSPSGCLQRVRRLEESGVIRGYAAVVDESIFAVWSVLWVHVTLREGAQRRRSDFERFAAESPEVIEAHAVAGRFDYLLKISVPSIAGWDAVRTRLDPDDALIKTVEVLAGVRTTKAKSLHPLLAMRESA